jgi:hypothetical protein
VIGKTVRKIDWLAMGKGEIIFVVAAHLADNWTDQSQKMNGFIYGYLGKKEGMIGWDRNGMLLCLQNKEEEQKVTKDRMQSNN